MTRFAPQQASPAREPRKGAGAGGWYYKRHDDDSHEAHLEARPFKTNA